MVWVTLHPSWPQRPHKEFPETRVFIWSFGPLSLSNLEGLQVRIQYPAWGPYSLQAIWSRRDRWLQQDVHGVLHRFCGSLEGQCAGCCKFHITFCSATSFCKLGVGILRSSRESCLSRFAWGVDGACESLTIFRSFTALGVLKLPWIPLKRKVGTSQAQMGVRDLLERAVGISEPSNLEGPELP